MEQATSPTLSADAQQRFTQAMLRRIDDLYAEAILKQGVRHLGSDNAEDLRKTLSERLCETFCNEQRQLHEKYHLALELGGDHQRELIKDIFYVFVTMLIPLYPETAYLMSLYMVLYVIRIRMDNWCSKRCQKNTEEGGKEEEDRSKEEEDRSKEEGD